MSPLFRAMLLLAAGQVAGQVASAMVGARLDPIKAGVAPAGTLPVGGGASRNDDLVMVGGSGGMIYLAARQRNPTARVFMIGMAMGFVAPVTQAIATALANRVVPAAA